MPDDDKTFFEKERDKLSADIESNFEHLLTSSNLLNRKLEEMLTMTKEYDTIAALWERFVTLMGSQASSGDADVSSAPSADESLVVRLHDTKYLRTSGVPGTGGYTLHVPSTRSS